MENRAVDYGVSKSRICDALQWVEKTLIKDDCFALPSKREQVKSDREMYAVIIDAAECGTERPKKTKRKLFREGKAACDKRSDSNKWNNEGNNMCS